MTEVNKQTTKGGKPYYTGTLLSGEQFNFKVWDNSSAFSVLESTKLDGNIVNITGRWNEYQGMFCIVIDFIQDLGDGSMYGLDAYTFISTKYNIESYLESLKSIVYKGISEKGKVVVDKILFDNEDVLEAFKTEFAAKSYHDNCKGGLLAHTQKVCYLASVVLALYGDIVDKDLLIIGCLLHDIGKTREMHIGVYQPESKVTHRFLGVEMLDKDLIVETYGEDWYYELVSILLQHHGEYGEPCRTVSSYIVHNIDMLESKLTLLKQTLELDDTGRINIEGNYLSYLTRG